MLYKFAGSTRGPKASGDSSGGGKGRAASPPAAAGASASADSAAAGASASADSAAPTPPNARQALCARSAAAAEVYDFLIGHPDRATEIAVVATKTQDDSVQRLDALPPPPDSSPPPASSDIGQESPSDLDHGKAAPKNRKDPKKRKRASIVAAAAGADPEGAESPALPIGSPKWNRGSAQFNFFAQKYDVRHGTGIRFGPAITVSALLIQGPFPTEDKADAEEHRRQVQSAMLNVLDDAKVKSFIEEGLTRREEMTHFCLARMESPRVTKQRGIAALQTFLNTHFFGATGCTPLFRGTRLTYHYCIEAVS